jgi:peptide/nickel transport system substrate-binding protein
MVEWVEGQYIRVAKNENYWREGYPKLDEVIYKFIPDTNQLLAQLLSGECDVGTEDGMDLDQSPFLAQAEAEGIIVPNFKRGTVWEHIDFGMASVDGRYQFFGPLGYDDTLDPNDPASWVGSEAWETSKKVRKAFAHCIDRQRMVDEALYGKSSVISTFIPEDHPMYPGDDQLSSYDYDPEAGIALLAEAGWTDTDGDEIVDRNGIPFSVSINTTSGNKMREIITQITQEDMKSCGVEVIIELMPASEYFGDGPDGPLFGRHFDLGEFAWLTGVEPPTNLYYCDQWPSEDNGWSGQNVVGYCNPAYDEAGKVADGTLSRDEQKPLFAKAQKIFSDDLPVLPLFQRISVSATRPEIKNYSPDPTINSAMWNIWEWELEE